MDENIRFVPVIARVRIPFPGIVFLDEYRIVLCGWESNGKALPNVVKHVCTTLEGAQQIGKRMWKQYYAGLPRQISIWSDKFRKPVVRAKNF